MTGLADGVRFSNGSNRNRIYDNVIKVDAEGQYAIYMCESGASRVFTVFACGIDGFKGEGSVHLIRINKLSIQ